MTGVNFTIQNGGLGAVAPSPSQAVCVFGCSSGGTEETIAGPYTGGNNVVTENGYGPGTELVAYLAQAGITTYFGKLETITDGAASSVTHAGTGSSAMSVTGTPFDQYNVVVTVARAGTAGSNPEPGFKISLDGGQTSTAEIRMPASRVYSGLAATTGMTFTFTAATLVVADTYVFTTTPPTWDAGALSAGVAALAQSSKVAGLAYAVGAMSAAQAGTYLTALNAFLPKKKFIRGFGETRDIDFGSGETEAQWMTSVENNYATYDSNGIVVVMAAPGIVPSAISGIQFRRSIGWAAIKRACLVKFSRDLGAVEDGALEGITTVYHDEALQPGLDADRFMTISSIAGLPGYYVTNSDHNTMAAPGSDFSLIQYGRVIDEVSRVNYAFFVKKLSTNVRLERSGTRKGLILEKDALALESGANSAQAAAVVDTGNASDVTTIVARNDNILSTRTLTVTTKVESLGYLKTILVEESFVNPALGQ